MIKAYAVGLVAVQVLGTRGAAVLVGAVATAAVALEAARRMHGQAAA